MILFHVIAISILCAASVFTGWKLYGKYGTEVDESVKEAINIADKFKEEKGE